MTVASKIHLTLVAEETQDVGSLGGSAKLIHEVRKALDFPSGTSSGQTFFAYSRDALAVTTAGQAFDLVGSTLQSLVDAGEDLDLDELIAVFVENTGASVDLLVGAGTNPVPGIVETPASHRTRIRPGGFHLYYLGSAGEPLTGGSADTLTLDVDSGSTTARLWLVGR